LNAEGSLAHRIRAIAEDPGKGVVALLLLCLITYLPGVLRLPPVDRTEIVWADTSRAMVERGTWLDPRYGDEVQAYRPIGAFWAQRMAASFVGDTRDIRVYRTPSLVAVTLAVLALYVLALPLVGGPVAFTGATLFAVAPLTVLVSQLAIAEGLSLFPAVVAMLALARLYAQRDEETPAWLAPLFWAALGVAMLVNALLVPILVIATLIALFVMDRDLSWLRRLRPLIGAPIALLVAAPWLYVRHLQDGVPFAGMAWRDLLAALGGAQDMKLRAFPGTFVLALLLGFLPGTALIVPAARRLWDMRSSDRLARFLIAWVLGYLIYLEALSSKPGTYMVQTMYPALALAVALVVRDHVEGDAPPKFHLFAWPPLAAAFSVALLASVVVFAGHQAGIMTVAAYALVAWLFAMSARDGRSGNLKRWAVSGPLALAAFAVTLLGIILPAIQKVWPARQIEDFVAHSCDPGLKVGVVGFREPSAAFALGVTKDRQMPEAVATEQPQLAVVESRWLDRYQKAVAAKGGVISATYGCIPSYNVMRGCPMTFIVLGHGGTDFCFTHKDEGCSIEKVSRPPSKDCD